MVGSYYIYLQAEARAEDAERNNARLNMTISTLENDLEIAEDKYEKAKKELEETVAELTDMGV